MAGLTLLASFAPAQQALPSPAFEAASIKATASGDPRGSTFSFTPGGGLKVTNGTLKGLIESAYDVRDFKISGAAGWMNSQGYDVFAKTAPDDPQTPARSTQDRIKETRLRLRELLADRFHLTVHRETKELPIYALTVAKNGPKLKENATTPPGAGIRTACGQMTGTSTSMANLAIMLSRQFDRSVQDRTGLTGKYDFQLAWTPDAGPCGATADGLPPDGASIFTALQEQLGLKLESTRGPVEVIIVDHAEKAAEN
jgi:uncharacterized protein (TIGR03435 family)